MMGDAICENLRDHSRTVHPNARGFTSTLKKHPAQKVMCSIGALLAARRRSGRGNAAVAHPTRVTAL